MRTTLMYSPSIFGALSLFPAPYLIRVLGERMQAVSLREVPHFD